MHYFSFALFCLFWLWYSFVIIKLLTAGAWPIRAKRFAHTWFAVSFSRIVLLVWVLTRAFKVLGPVDRQVIKISAFAALVCTFEFPVSSCMVLEQVIAETFSRGPHNFALQPFRIVPRGIQLLAIHPYLYCLVLNNYGTKWDGMKINIKL